MAIIAADNFAAGAAIVPHDIAEFFRVDSFRQSGGADDVTKQYGKLPTLGILRFADGQAGVEFVSRLGMTGQYGVVWNIRILNVG